MQVVFESTHLCSSTFIIILTEACSLSPYWWFNCHSNFNQELLEELCAFWLQELWSKLSSMVGVFSLQKPPCSGVILSKGSVLRWGLQCQTFDWPKMLRIFSYTLKLWALLLTLSVIQNSCFELMVKKLWKDELMTRCRPCGSGDDIQPLDKTIQKNQSL